MTPTQRGPKLVHVYPDRRPLYMSCRILAVLAMGFCSQSFAQDENCGTSEKGIWRCVAGVGNATIVLNAGARLTSRTWAPLVDDLAALGVVVRFDRPGLGRSPAVEGPRTPEAIARELAVMIDELGRDRSLILVGHSAGGYHMLRFAADHPDRVTGVLLVDTPHPEFEDRRLALLTEEQRRERESAVAASRAAASASVRAEYLGAQVEGAMDFAEFPDTMPLIVVTADAQDFGYANLSGALRTAWIEEQAQWLKLSHASRLVIVSGAGHMVHRERPDIIVDAVRDLAERAMGH